MKRALTFASLAVISVLAGCSANSTSQDPSDSDGNPAPSASSTSAPSSVPSSIEPSGMYKIEDSNAYTWLKMQNGLYGAWAAGAACNQDYSKAPASCLTTGTYQINDAQSEILFIDDATGAQVTSPYEVTAFGIPGTTTTQNSGGSKSGDSQKPVATAWNLKKCLQAMFMVCNLLNPDPSGTGPEPLPEPTIELPASGKKTAQG